MRWEEMPKGHTSVAELIKQFETHCRLEGKPETTCRWYREILNRFLEWAGDICLDEFTLEKIREYLGFLKTRPRYAGHPTTPSNGETVSAYTFRHHAVVLRLFSRWLHDEGYTMEHRLERVKTPKVPETVVDILTAEEIRRVLESEPPNTPHGSRNLDLDRGILKAFGKGSKERVVPFGYTTTKALHRYVLHFRPNPGLPQFDYVFLQQNGWPLTKSAMEMVAKRIGRRTGIDRFHWHLLRRTFTVNYLVNGGDAFSLQRILEVVALLRQTPDDAGTVGGDKALWVEASHRQPWAIFLRIVIRV